VLYCLLTGRFPFGAPKAEDVAQNIIGGRWEALPWFSPALRDLFSKLFDLRPLHRAVVRDLFRHPWLADSPLALKPAKGSDDTQKNEAQSLRVLAGLLGQAVMALVLLFLLVFGISKLATSLQE